MSSNVKKWSSSKYFIIMRILILLQTLSSVRIYIQISIIISKMSSKQEDRRKRIYGFYLEKRSRVEKFTINHFKRKMSLNRL